MATFSEDRVKEIIAKELEVDAKQVTPEAKFIEDLGADSSTSSSSSWPSKRSWSRHSRRRRRQASHGGRCHELSEVARDGQLSRHRAHNDLGGSGLIGAWRDQNRKNELNSTNGGRVWITGAGVDVAAREQPAGVLGSPHPRPIRGRPHHAVRCLRVRDPLCMRGQGVHDRRLHRSQRRQADGSLRPVRGCGEPRGCPEGGAEHGSHRPKPGRCGHRIRNRWHGDIRGAAFGAAQRARGASVRSSSR